MRLSCDTRAESVWRLRLDSADDEDAALDASALAALEDQLVAAGADTRCRVLVLEGVSGRFCRGMQLQAVAAGGSVDRETIAEGVRRYADCLLRLRVGRPALIAVVDGPALGGGLGLAAVADCVIASERARFGLPEALVGLVPAMVLPVLLERAPAQKVRRLALGGPALDAAGAERLGLVDVRVEAADDALGGPQLERALRAEIKQMLRLSPAAVAELRRFSARLSGITAEQGIAAGAELTGRHLEDPAVLAGIRAFLEGEPAPWLERYRPARPDRETQPDEAGEGG